jgi:hypothetical protein
MAQRTQVGPSAAGLAEHPGLIAAAIADDLRLALELREDLLAHGLGVS